MLPTLELGLPLLQALQQQQQQRPRTHCWPGPGFGQEQAEQLAMQWQQSHYSPAWAAEELQTEQHPQQHRHHWLPIQEPPPPPPPTVPEARRAGLQPQVPPGRPE